jgi:HK97 family phage prohead protease
MKMTHKSISLELKLDEGSRRISGYGSTFGNVDSYNDIVVAGAFAKSIGKRKVKMLFEHRDLIGAWDVVREDSKGLYLEGSIPNTTLGNDVYELAKSGALDSMSIGFRVIDSEYNSQGIRLLKQIDLFEVSLVTFPANEMAAVTGVKSAPETVREFEAFLQGHGYSDRESTLIASKGFAAVLSARESRGNMDDARESRSHETLNSALEKALTILKG